MSKAKQSEKQIEDSNTEGLSPNVKGIVSLMIFIHLFALGVALFSNAPASSFQVKLRRTPLITSYLQTFFMDTNYRFSMTLQELNDISWMATINTKAPGLEEKSFSFPNADMKSTTEVLPYHNLAQLLFELDYDGGDDNVNRNSLIVAVGRSQFDNVVRELLDKYDSGEKDFFIQRAEAGEDWAQLKAYDTDKDEIISGEEIYLSTEVTVECNGIDLLNPEQFANEEEPQVFNRFKVLIKAIKNGNQELEFSIFNPISNNIESAPAAKSSVE